MLKADYQISLNLIRSSTVRVLRLIFFNRQSIKKIDVVALLFLIKKKQMLLNSLVFRQTQKENRKMKKGNLETENLFDRSDNGVTERVIVSH